MLAKNITELIGNTPLLRLGNGNIYAKLEYFNPLHSVKDRAALYMIEGAEKRGELEAGGTVVEATSGNTGIGLTYIALQKGYKPVLVMPENMSDERKKLLRHLGAEVVLTPKEEGMAGAHAKADEIARERGAFVPDQFANPDNARAHEETTAKEIISDLGDIKPDYLVLTFGSGGTLTGLGRALKKVYPELKVVAVEPEESPLLSRGYAGAHGIQGIGANFIPDLLDKEVIDETVCVKSADAIVGATRAAKEYGTLIGISSGAALVASELVAARNSEAVVVTLFPDTGERYLSVWES
ncbi:MAG: cysteine synthase A [Firmicutes bacterium]|uniref:cysteine synthase n=1 Tax=Candidatus Stercoripulliclostridium pullicola TaxID=2840953 RepID=A0A940DH05_9FIRM|nr:cysteine synthase A [Candidatus Stercoripulliclostridium pullicola]